MRSTCTCTKFSLKATLRHVPDPHHNGGERPRWVEEIGADPTVENAVECRVLCASALPPYFLSTNLPVLHTRPMVYHAKPHHSRAIHGKPVCAPQESDSVMERLLEGREQTLVHPKLVIQSQRVGLLITLLSPCETRWPSISGAR